MSDFIVLHDPSHKCALPDPEKWEVGARILCRAKNGDLNCNKSWILRLDSYMNEKRWQETPATHYEW